jgi:broad specificity phosphatase PhoE
LGQALARAKYPPALLFHSPLLRAQQTAEIVQRQIQQQQSTSSSSSSPLFVPLNTLAELDFGPVAEGKPVELVRAEMAATYLAWESGHLEARMVQGGESGREVRTETITHSKTNKSRKCN